MVYIDDNVEPDAVFTADAGQEYGVAQVWEVDGRSVIKYGNDAVTHYDVVDAKVDDLAAWLESPDLDGLDAVLQTATIRGSSAVPEADENDAGPYYILVTRYWYGPRRSHDLLRDDLYQSIRAFDAYADAVEAVDALDQGIYVCSHNESSSPSYKIVTA